MTVEFKHFLPAFTNLMLRKSESETTTQTLRNSPNWSSELAAWMLDMQKTKSNPGG